MKWLAAGLLLLVVALTLGLHFLALALLLAAALWHFSRHLAGSWIEGLRGHRAVSSLEAVVGDVVTVQLNIGYDGRWPLLWALGEELLPRLPAGRESNWLTIEGQPCGVFRLGSGETLEWKYSLRCHRRGYWQLGPLVVETGDVFGMNRRYRVLCDPVWLLVRPEIIPLAGYDVESRRPIGEIVMTHRLFEDPTRTAGVRRYEAGDPLSRVHWRATARTGSLQCRVMEPTSLAGATLLIDFHQDSYPSSGEPVRSDLAITAAASIANLLHEMNQQFGLLSNGRDAVDRIRTEGWRGDARTRNEARASATMAAVSDRLRPVRVPTTKAPERLGVILDQLARLELTDGMTLEQLVAGDTGWLARDATVIAIVTGVSETAAIALDGLRRRGMAVVAILNCYGEEETLAAAAWLLARSIPVHHLRDRDSIPEICRQMAAAGVHS